MTQTGWVRVQEVPGGQVVFCRLCGSGKKRHFRASDTNYAEALRLATAYSWEHEHSDAHGAALAAFHSDKIFEATSEERLLARIFDRPEPDETQLRRQAAREAARKVQRSSQVKGSQP